jgi:hypothetical protein
MSELSTDSVAATEQTPETPASGPQLGDGFQEPDISLGDSEPAPTEQTEEGDTPPPTEATSTTPPSSAPLGTEEGLRQADYTRKTQDLAEGRRALDTERQALQQERLAFQQQTTAPPPANPVIQNLQAALNDPNLSQEDRMGLGALIQMQESSEQQQAMIAELTEWKEKAEAHFLQTSQTVQQMNQTQESALDKQKTTQWFEAVQAFGAQTVRDNVKFLDANWGDQAHANGTNLTVAELISMRTGQPFQAAQVAQQENRLLRQQAKQDAAVNGATHHTPDAGDGLISVKQAKAEIQATL